MAATIISLDEYRKRPNDTTQVASGSLDPPKPTITTLSPSEANPVSSARTDPRDVYPGGESSRLGDALKGLSSAIELVNEAAAAMEEDEFVQADNFMLRFHAALPTLFTFRDLSDGFGALVNALDWAIRNRDGVSLDREQILAVRDALTNLRARPFMAFQLAADETLRLEKTGLVVDPPDLSAFADLEEDSGPHG